MKKKYVMNFLSIMLIITLILYTVINLIICGNKSFAAINQTQSTDINSIDSNKYPQIKEMLQTLKSQHPNWNFKILYTDIDWNEAIANEYVGHNEKPRNLAPANNSKYDSTWRCAVCGNTTYDNGNWYCASEAALAYMMDPRNSANYSDVFQFMQLSYADCSTASIKKMASNTFLNNDSYINTLIDAAKKYNVNPYYLVGRILQEQSKNGSALSDGKGYNGQYVGYYNVFNIGASGNGKNTIILNGLKRAQAKGWNSIEKAITGGTEVIAESYISKGQDTLYFQKFDVENSDGNLYWHQYMQNILAAQSEGSTLRKTFESAGAVDANYTFIIPLYKNMPVTKAVRPSESNTPATTDLVKVNVNKTLSLRSGASKSFSKVGTLYKDEIITRISKASTKVDGTYWDYVMKSDGTKGYAARETYDYEPEYKLYLVPVNQNNNTTPAQPENNQSVVKNDKVKVNKDSHQVITVPNATGNDFANLIGGNVTVKNASGQVMGLNDKLATGCTINDTYSVAVLGDVNGDGEIKATDYMTIKNYIMGTKNLSDVQKNAADVNQDGNIKATDYMTIKNYIMGTSKINIK